MHRSWRQIFPTRWLILLLAIGTVDLIVTAVLHQRGLIVELNPIMRPFIERSEWLFVLVKGATLVLAWTVIARHAQKNLQFVRTACAAGCIAYSAVWTIWFTIGSMG